MDVLNQHRRYRLLKIELEAKESNGSEEEIQQIKHQIKQLIDYNKNITAVYDELTENVLKELKEMNKIQNKKK